VAKAAERFDRTAGTRRGWSPSGGATLATFFTGMCIDEFPNQFRSWCGARKKLQREVPVSEPIQLIGPAPEDALLAREALTEAFQSLTHNQQTALYLQAQCYNHKEIATEMGLTERAVEGLVRRGRHQLNASGEGSGE